MSDRRSRRGFLADVGRSTLLTTLGTAAAVDLGIVSSAFAVENNERLTFGSLEPLVCVLQETPVEKLQTQLHAHLQSGTPLKTLVAAAALANARTFGGEDYIGFHTFMALSPALRMSTMMPKGSEALPVFKVLYRNTARIHDFGGRESEVLHPVIGDAQSADSGADDAAVLNQAIRSMDVSQAEQLLSSLVSSEQSRAFNALIPSVQENPEVHRTVLPFRAWEMRDIIGHEHALTLLRQSLRYCLRAEPQRTDRWNATSKMLIQLLDEFHLEGRPPGTRTADDSLVEQLSATFSTASPHEAARAAAMTLSEGFDPRAVGEAISLAASRLVLMDGGRLPQYEDRLKPAGCVHGDSTGVHASDAANAWRNMAAASNPKNTYCCLIIGAWQVARDREQPGNLLREPLPVAHHINSITAQDASSLIAAMEDAVRSNLQAHASAIAFQYCKLGLEPETLLSTLLKYAVSEDGALHAEKYFQTVCDDFRSTRLSLRSQHLVALSRVTASEYGKPAAGQEEARRLLGVV